MIIGISGKKQAGKDLIGKIIQYLTSPEYSDNKELSLEYFCKVYWSNGCPSGWDIVKFADKLKDMVCILIGCTRKQLEDEKFKNTELGEEWWRYRYRIQDREGRPIYRQFSDHEEQFKYVTKEVYDMVSEDNKKWHNFTIIKPTPRYFLQFIGTDLLRNQLHPQVWVNATMADYKPLQNGAIGNRQPDDLDDCPVEFPDWIMTDVRFPNEAEVIKDRGGVLIRVNRPNIKTSDNHMSETALDHYDNFDHIITNNDNLDDLIEDVRNILIEEQIIKG